MNWQSLSPSLRAGDYVLRPFIEVDAPAFAAAVRESMSTVGVWMTWAVTGYADKDAVDWFAVCEANRAAGTAHEFGIFGADGTSFIGGAGLNQLNVANACCNLGYWVRGPAQRKGAALAAVSALSAFAFEDLKLVRVEIVVAEQNGPSLAVARKSGATYECLARNRLRIRGETLAAHVFSIVPGV